MSKRNTLKSLKSRILVIARKVWGPTAELEIKPFFRNPFLQGKDDRWRVEIITRNSVAWSQEPIKGKKAALEKLLENFQKTEKAVINFASVHGLPASRVVHDLQNLTESEEFKKRVSRKQNVPS